MTDYFFKKYLYFGISLNKKQKKLFHGHGIRIGVQEISRYNWGDEELDIIAEIFHLIISHGPKKEINELTNLLAQRKTINFTFNNDIINRLSNEGIIIFV